MKRVRWETYSVQPVRRWLYRYVPIGNKARVILEKVAVL